MIPAPLFNLNGTLIPDLSAARVSVLDRSYLYGDSLYEVARTAGDHRLLHLQEHLERLESSARLCHMKIEQPLSFLAAEMERTVLEWQERARASTPSRTQAPDAYCRLVVSRGEGKIGFSQKARTGGTLFSIIVQKLETPSAADCRQGAHLRIVSRLRNHPRAIDPAMKSGNYLNSLLAFLEAEQAGGQDALLCDGEGFITEGTTFNIFYIKRGIIVTAPLDVGILDGITRRHTLAVAQKNRIPVREVRFPASYLQAADEAFLTSTTKDVFPVTRINDRAIGNGKPGPLTLKLRNFFQDEIPQWLSSAETRNRRR